MTNKKTNMKRLSKIEAQMKGEKKKKVEYVEELMIAEEDLSIYIDI